MNRYPLLLPPPVQIQHCQKHWRIWKNLACQERSYPLLFLQAIHSILTELHYIFHWHLFLWPRQQVWILSFGEQLMIGLTLMLTSKGVAAVPRASLSF